MTRAHKRREEWLERQKKTESAATAAVPTRRKLPGNGAEELRELLLLKVGLQQHLQHPQRKPVIVSVDVVDDSWVFVVRGMKPPVSWWKGYPIYWTPSSNVSTGV